MSTLQYCTVLLIFSPIYVIGLRFNRVLALIVALSVSVLAVVPFGDVSLVLALKGLFADLSITTITLLVAWPLHRAANLQPNKADTAWLCVVVLIFAMVLYPMALGIGNYDTYAIGFRPWVLLTLVAVLGVLATQRQYWLSATTLALVLGGYWFKVLDSQNLWDYLLDPILVIFAVTYLIRYAYPVRIWQRYRGTRHST